MATKKYIYDNVKKKILLQPIGLPVEIDVDYVLSIQPDIFGTDLEMIKNCKEEIRKTNLNTSQQLTDIKMDSNKNLEKSCLNTNENLNDYTSNKDSIQINQNTNLTKYQQVNFNYPKRRQKKKYKTKQKHSEILYKYPETQTVDNIEIMGKTFKNLLIASKKDLEDSKLEFYEILNYYKIVIYILNNLNEDFYYDENINMHVSKINKKTEFLTFLKKKTRKNILTQLRKYYITIYFIVIKRESIQINKQIILVYT